MKVITLITRRPELTRSEFMDYYENHHAPLGARHFPFEKYVRNHVVASQPNDVGFDCLMECWLDRGKALASLDGPLGDLFAADEAKFMSTRGIGIDVIEHLLAGPPRGVDPRGQPKYAFFLRKGFDMDQSKFLALASDWGLKLAATRNAFRATLDEAMPGHMAHGFTANAILTLWGGDADIAAPDLPGCEIQNVLTLQSEETTPEELAKLIAG